METRQGTDRDGEDFRECVVYTEGMRRGVPRIWFLVAMAVGYGFSAAFNAYQGEIENLVCMYAVLIFYVGDGLRVLHPKRFI